MPLQIGTSKHPAPPQPQFLTLANFKRGVITLIDKSRLPQDALEEATNCFLYEDGQPGPRPGVNWYGSVSPNAAAWTGMDYFDFAGAIHLVGVAGGNVYRSTDDGTTWTLCSGATLTSGLTVYMNQYNSFLYLSNGTDPITLYDGSTTLTQYVALATPTAPTAAGTGLGTTNVQSLYKVAAVNTIGFSAASPVATGDTLFTTTRDGWSSTAYVTLTIPATTGAVRYDIYNSEDGLNFYYLDSATPATTGASVTYRDDGSAIIIPSTTAPTDNTTQGPLVQELTNVGSRMYGVRDANHRYRIWFTSGGYPFGAFSNSYDGGYLDWQIGGKFIPQKVADYRDGKGTPLATIFCKSADGQGCVIQMSLDTLTVGNVSITVPSAYKLPGSRGTPAPGSVVNVLNDFMFYNSQAFYNLGSRAQFLNLLSTDESSANIRPTVRGISTAGEGMIASIYFLARVYFSVPYGSSTNNATAVYDTERKAWLPKAFDIGFWKFLRYTDTSGTPRLLALKSGDTQLSEISDGIQGDYGVAFTTSLVTGLYPVTKDRFEFQFTEEGEVEFSNPQGDISIELLGSERTAGFSSINTETVTSTTVTTGWDTFAWDVSNWDDTSVVPDTFSESSIKRYFLVQRELNNVQWRITTSTLSARYILRTLQTWGTNTEAGHPSEWLIS